MVIMLHLECYAFHHDRIILHENTISSKIHKTYIIKCTFIMQTAQRHNKTNKTLKSQTHEMIHCINYLVFPILHTTHADKITVLIHLGLSITTFPIYCIVNIRLIKMHLHAL